MKRNTTAKFGSFLNSESFLDRFKTQQTDIIGRSQTRNQQNESQMNISQLQIPAKDERSINIISEGAEHQVNGDVETIYRCPICDRLRAICPYKGYQTYGYCQKCAVHNDEVQRNQRQRINSNATPSFPKELNSTFAQTKGQSLRHGIKNLKPDYISRHMTQVDKVRFIQSNNVYPLVSTHSKPNNISQYNYHPNHPKQSNTNNYNSLKLDRPRSTTQRLVHHVPTPQKVVVPTTSNIQEIIFYPVIHNKLVYKSAQKEVGGGEGGQLGNMKYYRYQSNNYSRNKSQRRVDKVVSDFLQSTQPEEILTPFQFKKLADSIYRQTNPNISSD